MGLHRAAPMQVGLCRVWLGGTSRCNGAGVGNGENVERDIWTYWRDGSRTGAHTPNAGVQFRVNFPAREGTPESECLERGVGQGFLVRHVSQIVAFEYAICLYIASPRNASPVTTDRGRAQQRGRRLVAEHSRNYGPICCPPLCTAAKSVSRVQVLSHLHA